MAREVIFRVRMNEDEAAVFNAARGDKTVSEYLRSLIHQTGGQVQKDDRTAEQFAQVVERLETFHPGELGAKLDSLKEILEGMESAVGKLATRANTPAPGVPVAPIDAEALGKAVAKAVGELFRARLEQMDNKLNDIRHCTADLMGRK